MPVTPSEAAAEAGVVFVGTARQLVGRPEEGSPEPVTYVFTVERVLKGTVAGPTVKVSTNNGAASCGVEFTIGERYAVYAIDADGTLFVNLCGGTHRVAAGVPPRPATPHAPAALGEPASPAEANEELPRMPVEGVIAAVGIIGVLIVAIVLISRSRNRD
ncbi:hypothetical protein [Cryptosporangium aurantiacum]|uniref:hypothetical protein n=1 Tax=Cryptosporangium aurantiacum TaxID=134849 RepID=UPI0015C0D35D|nr:hypothetical protein [Cryptosporangium aurantiacum]